MSGAALKFDSVEAFAGLLAELADPFGDETIILARHGIDADELRALKERWRGALASTGPKRDLASQFTAAFATARTKLAARPEVKPRLAREAALVPLSPPGESRPPPLLQGGGSGNRPVRRALETEEVQFVPLMRLPFVPPLQQAQADEVLVDDDNATLPIGGPNARRVLPSSDSDELGSNTLPGDAGPLGPALPFHPTTPEKKS